MTDTKRPCRRRCLVFDDGLYHWYLSRHYFSNLGAKGLKLLTHAERLTLTVGHLLISTDQMANGHRAKRITGRR